MPHIRTANPEDYIGGDVRRVVRDTFKTACNHHSIHRLLRSVRLFLDHLQQISLGTPVHAIDLIVHFAHLVGKARIAFEQRQDRRPDHASRHLTHGGEIHGQFDLVGLQNVARAF